MAVIVVSRSVLSNSLQPHGLQRTRLPCPPLPSPGACSNSCPLSWWCYLTISSSVVPFSFCLQSFPASTGLKTETQTGEDREAWRVIVRTVERVGCDWTTRQTEQNREARNKPTHIRSTNIWQGSWIFNGKRMVAYTNGTGKIWHPHTKEWNWTPLLYLSPQLWGF